MRPAAGFRFRRRWFPVTPTGHWAIPDKASEFDLFLLMGQSNMAGFGCVRDDDPWQPGDLDPEPGVVVLGGQCKIDSIRPRGRMAWRPASHPLHLNQRSAGFGLGLPFAAKLREVHPEKLVGLIPCAWGGAPIAQLGSGSPLYANCLRRARLAGKTGQLRAVLWHQGESDTFSEDLAIAHAGKLQQLIEALRRDLGEPALPVLIGDLPDFAERQRRVSDPVAAGRIATVRAGLRRVAQQDPHARFIESEGLEGVDQVHFGRSSLIEFGRRFAEAWTQPW